MMRGGPISVAEYMQEALTNPHAGFYMTRDVFGRAGDFITSPEISQTFGEVLGAWAVHTWMQMGSPPRLDLVELGPGRGTLMADLLRGTAGFKGFVAAVRTVHLVEVSPALRGLQRTSLRCPPSPLAAPPPPPTAPVNAAATAAVSSSSAATSGDAAADVGSSSSSSSSTASGSSGSSPGSGDALGGAASPSGGTASAAGDEPQDVGVSAFTGCQVQWHPSLAHVPKGPHPALYIAHEFFDALPVHQFVHDPKRGWLEKLVDVGGSEDDETISGAAAASVAAPTRLDAGPRGLDSVSGGGGGGGGGAVGKAKLSVGPRDLEDDGSAQLVAALGKLKRQLAAAEVAVAARGPGGAGGAGAVAAAPGSAGAATGSNAAGATGATAAAAPSLSSADPLSSSSSSSGSGAEDDMGSLGSPSGPGLRMVMSPSATPAAAMLVGRRLRFMGVTDPGAAAAAAAAGGTGGTARLVPSLSAGRLETAGGGPPAVKAIEICAQGMATAEALAVRIGAVGGSALVIDYGKDSPYEDSLMAIRGHQGVTILDSPGSADLSAWVDFSALRQAVTESGAAATTYGPVSQGGFLRALGIEARLAALQRRAPTTAVADTLAAGVARLVEGGPGGMGHTYSAFIIQHKDLPPPAGV